MADDKNKVPLFDGSNFSNWKFRMKTLLDELDLLDILETPMNASVEAVDASDITAQDKVKKKAQLKKGIRSASPRLSNEWPTVTWNM
jgi:hypothetical protein